ncbi:MAG TPA: DUF5009 domain-containing protein [Candidatus Hydrogenedentes bacterium]|nr:DUF5009 domain-containing protein [Candidatus Hydrogenedentota bacterium]HOK88594.1 DUF5009 domain-containing protein [Candidatus Hydrogenedentota bacterium]HPO29957.1 DUF5009 domain-containing protein [Candidatus Hydrogenedentota bacterium]
MTDTVAGSPLPESQPASTPAPGSARVMSIDALRGFDMFWIAGGGPLVASLAALLCYPHPVPPWLVHHMKHVEWTGFSGWDLIMPLFLFLSGVSIPFAYARRLSETRDYRAIYRRMARRFALLWILGMIAQGNLLQVVWASITGIFGYEPFDSPVHLHLFSNTLQAIAVGYVIAAVAFLHLSPRQQIGLCAGLLVVYWGLMMFVPGPDFPAGHLEPRQNLALWIDEQVLGRFRDGTTYAWILPGLGFGASVLLGSFAGQVLRVKTWTPGRHFLVLCGLGIGCLAGGWLWSFHFPIIKHLWTSSMVLWAAGWSYLLLAAFYLLIDIWGFRKPAFPFVVLGANAIVAYILPHIIEFDDIVMWIGRIPEAHSVTADFVISAIAFAMLWIPLYGMYRKKIFVKV